MPSLKEVKTRILSVESTKKITLARQMVSSARLHQSQSALGKAAMYNHSLESVVLSLADESSFNSPLIEKREGGAIAVVAMASNSGMCGAFNAKMLKEVLTVQKECNTNVLFYPIGKKLKDALRHAGCNVQGDFDHLSAKASFTEVSAFVDDLIEAFYAKQISKVILLHYHFKNMAVQKVMRSDFLPYVLPAVSQAATSVGNCILEPSRVELQTSIVPMALRAQLYAALIDTQTSEHAARTMAMQLATENADEMLEELRLNYNKLRQQNITSELLDIVGGSFA